MYILYVDLSNLLVILQSFREERGRSRRDYPSRSEDRSYHGRGSNPRSRHLWVGNIPHSLTESDVAHHFLHFGELESIAFQPGRSYAFINYRDEEDAYAAFKELQGFVIEGNPLRIEYTKGVSFVNLCLTFICYRVGTFYFVNLYYLPCSIKTMVIQLRAIVILQNIQNKCTQAPNPLHNQFHLTLCMSIYSKELVSLSFLALQDARENREYTCMISVFNELAFGSTFCFPIN